jgi:hypothetical protein
LLKFINAADIENSEVYQNRGLLFSRITQQVWGEFLGIKDIKIKNIINEKTKEIEYKIDIQNEEVSIKGRKLRINLIGRIKSKKSIDEKLTANRTYKSFMAANDLFGYQITGENEEETKFLMNEFTDFHRENARRIFRTDEPLCWYNKGLIDEHTFQDEDKITIKERKKPATSPDYTEAKNLPVMAVNGKLFSIENKFVFPDRKETNEN